MSRLYLLLAVACVIVCVSLLAGCSSETQETVPSTSETAVSAKPDPTVVDAKHYTTELENDRVRVVRINYGPGETSVMHHHPDSIAVFLTDHDVSFKLPDGSTDTLQAKAGQHLPVQGGMHLPTNVSDKPWEVVLVELKQDGPSGSEASGPDPVEVDEKHYRTEFEDDRVRVLRIKYGPGETSVMHYHPAGVAIYLSDHHVEFTLPDGTVQAAHGKAGEVVLAPAGPHLPKNVGKKPLEVLLVELK